MAELFLKIVNTSISATWLVLAVVVLRFVLKKAPKWVNVLLWGLVAFRLVCPVTLESAMSLIPSTEVISPEIMMDATPEIHTGIDSVNSVVNPVITEAFAPAPAASANPLQIWIPVLSVIWCIGMAAMLLYTLVSYGRLRYRVRMAIRVKGNIYLSEYVASPFVLGVFKPRIYLPCHICEPDRRHVIAHERAHIRRKDHLWKPLGFLLLTVHWFNPILWLAYILLCRDIELACDEKVIKELGTEQRADYSQALLHCSVTHRSITACPIAFGEVGVKQRVKNVLNYKKPAFWVIAVCLMIVIIVSVCFLTSPESEENDLPMTITMTLDYVNRSRALLIFEYPESLPDGEFQISEAYALEHLTDGKWEELPSLLEERTFHPVVDVDSMNYDAWNSLNLEEDYGRLPDGTYRIRKDITLTTDTGSTETRPYYAEFTIGGTAQDYLTLMLEDITPTGATLYIQETVDDPMQLIYNGNEGFWLERWQDGQWTYLEPTTYIEPIFADVPRYIHALQYSSYHMELDWSNLHGELPAGTYRIAREVTSTGSSDPRVCTAYAEFTIGSDWGIELFIDRISENGITVNLLLDDSIQQGEYFFAGSTLQVRERLGSWTDVLPMSEPSDGRDIASSASACALIWDEDLYQLTEGQHRIGIRIKHVLPDGTEEYNTLYEYFDPSTYAWGVSLDVTNITCTDWEVYIEYRQTFSQTLPEGSLSESALLGLQKRENNQWIDVERKYNDSDLPDILIRSPGSNSGGENLKALYDGITNGTYRLVSYVTRHYSDGTTDTRPVYAVFVVDSNIETIDN